MRIPETEGVFPGDGGWFVMLYFQATPIVWGSYPRRTIAEAVEADLRRKRAEQQELRRATQTKPRREYPRRG